MQSALSILFPVMILYFSGLVDWFQVKFKQSVYYKPHWSETILTFSAAALILYMEWEFFGGNYMYVIILLVFLFILIIPFKMKYKKVILLDAYEKEAEKTLEKHIKQLDLPIESEFDPDKGEIKYVLPDKEEITLWWNDSWLNESEGAIIKMRVKSRGQAGFISEVLEKSMEEWRVARDRERFRKRLRKQGVILVLPTAVFLTFILRSLLT